VTEYTYRTTVPVRFSDLDPVGHVNQSVYATFLEETRADYWADVVGESFAGIEAAQVHLEIDFRRELGMDHDVEVAQRVSEMGESSLTFEYELRADGEVAATARAVLVAFDTDERTSKPIPDDIRERIEDYEGL
jgi:acyl-CoA thioester hydrolase